LCGFGEPVIRNMSGRPVNVARGCELLVWDKSFAHDDGLLDRIVEVSIEIDDRGVVCANHQHDLRTAELDETALGLGDESSSVPLTAARRIDGKVVDPPAVTVVSGTSNARIVIPTSSRTDNECPLVAG
jgi:hypothetical protein